MQTILTRDSEDGPIKGAPSGHRRKTFRKYMNRRRPGQDWEPSVIDVEATSAAPPNWRATYEPTQGMFGGNLGVGVGDRTSPTNKSLITLRREDDPASWVNILVKRALFGATWRPPKSSAPHRTRNNQVVWKNLWTVVDASLTMGAGGAKWEAMFPVGSYVSEIEYSFKVSEDSLLELGENGELILQREGEVKLRILPPLVYDEDPEGELGRGGKSLPSQWEERMGTTETQIFAILIDTTQAIGKITVDPTAVFSGTGEIEDTHVYGRSGYEDNNYGGLSTVETGWRGSFPGRYQNALWRILDPTTNIPAGVITGFRHIFWRTAFSFSVNAGTMSWYRLKDGNVSWVEGTATGGSQVGSCDWFHTQHSTLAWLGGSNGAGVYDTDFYGDVSPPDLSYSGYTAGPAVGPFSVALPTQWAVDWRDSIRANAGFVIIGEMTNINSIYAMLSTEAGANNPSFEIDYFVEPETPVSRVDPDESRTELIAFAAPFHFTKNGDLVKKNDGHAAADTAKGSMFTLENGIPLLDAGSIVPLLAFEPDDEITSTVFKYQVRKSIFTGSDFQRVQRIETLPSEDNQQKFRITISDTRLTQNEITFTAISSDHGWIMNLEPAK